MEELQLFRGDTVLVRGKKRKDTVLIVLADEDLDDGSARINRVVRHNLRVKHGDMITISPCPDIKYVRQTYIFGLEHLLRTTRPSELPYFPLPTPLRALQAPFSTYSSPPTSAKLTALFAKAISSLFAVV